MKTKRYALLVITVVTLFVGLETLGLSYILSDAATKRAEIMASITSVKSISTAANNSALDL
jgi:hypothetical protein